MGRTLGFIWAPTTAVLTPGHEVRFVVRPLRDAAKKLADGLNVTLDLSGIPAFNARVYAFTRTIPRGETRTYGEVAGAV